MKRMKNINPILSIILLLICFSSSNLTANEYPVSSISEVIKNKADAVIRLEERTFAQKDQNEATETVKIVISVLNERGDKHAHFVTSQGRFNELKSFSGLLLSSTGAVTKKIKKSDLNSTAISENLATDDYWTFYNCNAPSYPYTVVYTYEVKHKNGVAMYTPFVPQDDFGLGVENAVYKLIVPASTSIMYKGNAFVGEPKKEKLQNDSIYTWTCSNLQAVDKEPLCPPITSLSPYVMISPKEFCLEKICGDMSSWLNTGKYLSQLIATKDALPVDTKQKVKELIDGVDDKKEIVRRLYEYLQQTTRYVSIQLGIGGWMPIAAEKVAKSGFGDCKALTNYMKALLAEANIPSVYTTIHTDRKHLLKDFSGMFQFNHVILMVPLQSDTLWLECTSQQKPFNYIHSDMSGHDVLLVNGEASTLCRIKDLSATEDKESNLLDIHIKADGSMTSEIKSEYKNLDVEGVMHFITNLPEKDKINQLNERLSIAKPRISNIKTEYIKQEIPEASISYLVEADKYGSSTGSRMFVPANPLRIRFGSIFTASERKHDILLNSTINRTDTITFRLPENFKIESAPKSFLVNSGFGIYSCIVVENDEKITFIHNVNIPRGRYKKEQYNELRDFLKKIDVGMSGRIVLAQAK